MSGHENLSKLIAFLKEIKRGYPSMGICPRCGSHLKEYADRDGHLIGCPDCGWDERKTDEFIWRVGEL